MPLCEFPIRPPGNASRPGEARKADANLIQQNGIASLVYGISGSAGTTDAHPNLVDGTDKALSSDRLSAVSSTTRIEVTAWQGAINQINAERNRRGRGDIDDEIVVGDITSSTKINHQHFNAMRDGINVSSNGSDQAYATDNSVTITTYSAAPGVQTSSAAVQNGIIYASDVNKLVADVNSAGRACICNCNYCSCNCNYCTCNCNYSCTCNCNYSDVTTKENIVYM